ncbi:polysaccharide deacetylase [Desulfovibrio sp. TomC]|nr:polysaccharide deacetylase [Desulfovibrio sp. TomC]
MFIPVLVLFCCVVAACPAAQAGKTETVQSALWTPAELAGSPAERKSGRLGAPDTTSPVSVTPPSLPPLPAKLTGSIRRVDTHGAKLVALTFDLCELADQASGYDAAVIDALRAAGARATLFVGGKWMRSHPLRAMQLIADPLFEIGNHAWTHGNFGRLHPDAMIREIAWTQAQYAELRSELVHLAQERGVSDKDLATIPQAPVLFRFPYGRCRPEALDMLAKMGLAAVQWNLTTGDPDSASTPERVLKNVLERVRPGDIIIGHANGNGHGTGQALPGLLAELTNRGYTLVTVSELLAAGRPVVTSDCYDSHPGDTAQYDAVFGDGTTHPRKKSGSGPLPKPTQAP